MELDSLFFSTLTDFSAPFFTPLDASFRVEAFPFDAGVDVDDAGRA